MPPQGLSFSPEEPAAAGLLSLRETGHHHNHRFLRTHKRCQELQFFCQAQANKQLKKKRKATTEIHKPDFSRQPSRQQIKKRHDGAARSYSRQSSCFPDQTWRRLELFGFCGRLAGAALQPPPWLSFSEEAGRHRTAPPRTSIAPIFSTQRTLQAAANAPFFFSGRNKHNKQQQSFFFS